MPDPALVMRQPRRIVPPRADSARDLETKLDARYEPCVLGGSWKKCVSGCDESFGTTGGTGGNFHSPLKLSGTHVTGVAGKHAFPRGTPDATQFGGVAITNIAHYVFSSGGQ